MARALLHPYGGEICMRPPKRLTRMLRSRGNAILRPGRNCWRIERAEQSGLLVDGHDYYRAFYRSASNAERYILISGWQFDSSVALLRGTEAERAQEPVGFLDFL